MLKDKLKLNILKLFYFIVLISPNLFFSFKGGLRGIYPFFILLAILKKWNLFLIATAIFFISVPGPIFFATSFRAPLNEGFWIIVNGTNLIETKDYVHSNLLLPIGLVFLLSIIWYYLYRNLKDQIIGVRLRIFCFIFTIIPIFHFFKNDNHLKEFNHHFTESYPMNLIFSYASAQNDMKAFKEMKMIGNPTIDFEKSENSPKVVVLVIGESAGQKRHEIYGHKTQNTPNLMRRQKEITLFSDVITLHPHTVASIPVMLTKQKGLYKSFEFEYSFLSVFKNAGYKTFWISNQASIGGGLNSIGAYSFQADFSKYFHLHNSNNPTSYDELIVEEFKKQITDVSEKKFFVLHLQGSHYGFTRRYPKSFDNFADPYDNTIFYTDYILDQIMQTLEKEKVPSNLVYLSDHGLLLNNCGKAFTHFDNKEAYKIPFFVWSNSLWNKAYPELTEKLIANKDKSLTTEVVFDSLIDLAQIKYDNYDPKLSILSPNVNVGKRLVKTYKEVVDFDQSEDDKECHLVETN